MYLKTQIENLLRLAKAQDQREPYYEVLEKITLTGTEYFDLGYKVSDFAIGDTIRFEGIVKGTDASTITSSGSQLMYSLGNDGGQWLGKAQNGTKYAFGSSNQSTISFNEEVLADVTITLSGNANKPTFTITGSVTSDTATSTITQRSATPTYYDFPLLFGAGTKSTGEKAYGGDYTIKCGKIYINGTMTKDYIPVLDNKMRPCLYDKISKTFTYAKKISGGTTAYVLGFKRWNKFDVDYIASDGNQYINTGFKFTNTSAFEITCAEVADFEASTVLCGARNNTDTTSNARIVDYSYSAPSVLRGEYLLLQRGGYDVNENVIYIPYDTEFHTYYQSPTRMSIDDTDRPTVPSLTSPNMDFYIFWQNVGTATAPAKAKIKVKSQKLWDNGTLVRDFKPSVRTYNNGTSVVTKAFLYDEVYNKAYDNAGTGSFKAYIIGYGNVFTRTGETTGKFIDANGNIQTNSNSAYSALLPIKCGETVTCVSGTASGNNYRYHVYDINGTWIKQALVLNPSSAEAITGFFVAPSNASFVRVSYANANTSDGIEVWSSLTTYEVGKSVSGTPSSTALGVSNCFDTGLYGTQDTTVKYIARAYDSTSSSGQLFGSYDRTTSTSQNLTINSTGTGNTAPIRFDGQVITTPIKIPINGFASIVNCRYGLWTNDTLHGTWGNVNDFTTLTTMLILKCNNSVNTRNNGCCYCLILEKDVPVAEFIPVRNASNTSVYGLYDKVSKTLNTGTGTINFNILD